MGRGRAQGGEARFVGGSQKMGGAITEQASFLSAIQEDRLVRNKIPWLAGSSAGQGKADHGAVL